MRPIRLLFCVLVLGCSQAPPSVTDGEPAGSVRYKQSPVSQVQIGFHSPGTKERVAFGVTDPEGKFRLFQSDGQPHPLLPGTYLVTAENIGEPTWTLPLKYLDPAKTPLHIKVAAGLPIEIQLP